MPEGAARAFGRAAARARRSNCSTSSVKTRCSSRRLRDCGLLFRPSASGRSRIASKPRELRSKFRLWRASACLTEPIGRNTAAAIALAAFHVRHAARGDAVMAVLPADHYIANPERYRVIVKAALEMAADPEKMIVLGIPPTRPETGFGYIERTGKALDAKGFPVYAVRRFTEKPALALAKEYAGSGTLSLECRNVFLARLDISRQSGKLFAEDLRCARNACGKHRQEDVRQKSSRHLSDS